MKALSKFGSTVDVFINHSFGKWKISCTYEDLKKIKQSMGKEGITMKTAFPERKLFGPKLSAADFAQVHAVCLLMSLVFFSKLCS